MKHKTSASDIEYLHAFIELKVCADEFHHKEHIRLAYVLLSQHDLDVAYTRLKTYLLGFLARHEVPASKFHETMTRAWLLAVKHFMQLSEPSSDFEDFIRRNDILSNKEIIFSHYSRDLISSDEARNSFVQPDLDPIPTYEEKNSRPY